MIKRGAHYKDKYLDGVQFNHKEIKPNTSYVKSYVRWNRKDAPVFKGVLNVLPNGRAVIFVNYVSYSGVKNKYKNYFGKEGLEIIHDKNSTKEEEKVWNNII